MVDREANIDLLFRNGLKDYEALPPAGLWEEIRPAVVVPLKPRVQFKAAAVAAILVASGLLTAMLVRNMPSAADKPVFTLASGTKLKSIQRENIKSPDKPGQNQRLAIARNESAGSVGLKPSSDVQLPYSLPSPQLFKSFIREPAPGEIRSGRPSGSLQKAYAAPFAEFTSEADYNVRENPPAKVNRWSIGAMVTPAYYSQFDISHDDAAQSIIQSEEPAFSYSGGLTFAYNISKRFTVQSGFSYSSLGQKIDGVTTYSGFGRYVQSKGDNEFQVMTSSGTISATNNDIYLADASAGAKVMSLYTREVFDPVKNSLSYISNSLIQNFNYLEVPVLLKYKIIDRNIDLKVIGGVSYNILIENSAYTVSGGTKYFIGKTDGLSPVTLSSSLGMGMEYNFSGKLSLNLEPTFRYYITPLGGLAGSSIHPYSFGILTGVSYKF